MGHSQVDKDCTVIADIDECATLNDCDMRPGIGLCTNTPGSHTCGCGTGYELAANKKTCQGE